MKCTECGANIEKGKMYCPACGVEVQMVSPYHVMEDEFFLDVQHQTADEEDGEEPEELLDETFHEMPRSLRKRNLYISMAVAALGLCVLLFASYVLRQSADEAAAFSDGYEQAVAALARSDYAGAQAAFAGMQAGQPEELSHYFWQAWLMGLQEETGKQKETLEKILSLDRENVYACKELIDLYVAQEDFEALHALSASYENSRLSALFSEYEVEQPAVELQSDALRQGDVLVITAAEGLNIYYTLDGTSPITNGTLYYAPIYLESGNYTVQATACNEQGYYSPVVSEEVAVEMAYQLGMPQVTPNSGEYLSPQTIYVSVPEGCSAYYTWNGSDPTTASLKYSGGIPMPEGNNVLSVILADEYGNTSSIQRVNYIYMP